MDLCLCPDVYFLNGCRAIQTSSQPLIRGVLSEKFKNVIRNLEPISKPAAIFVFSHNCLHFGVIGEICKNMHWVFSMITQWSNANYQRRGQQTSVCDYPLKGAVLLCLSSANKWTCLLAALELGLRSQTNTCAH